MALDIQFFSSGSSFFFLFNKHIYYMREDLLRKIKAWEELSH